MNFSNIYSFMDAARDCTNTMLENAYYVERELPHVDLPDELRTRIKELCSNLLGTKFDISTELSEMREILASSTPDNDGLERRIGWIVSWLGDDVSEIQSLVTALQNAEAGNSDNELACFLVTESATNIIVSYNQLLDEELALLGDSGRTRCLASATAHHTTFGCRKAFT